MESYKNNQQQNLDWYRSRLCYITGSRVGDLMHSSRKAGEVFGDTAKSYLYQIAAERQMNEKIINDDETFAAYVYQTSITTKSMQFGIDMEQDARLIYSKKTGREIIDVASCRHDTIPFFASSPDGVYKENDTVIGCLEIKCPNQNTFIKYKMEISDNESLKKVNPDYYYQCQSHMMCTGAQWCDFIIYCPWQNDPIHIVRIKKDEDAIDLITDKVLLANDFIDEITDGKSWKKAV